MPDSPRPRHDPSPTDASAPDPVVRCAACSREIARLADRIAAAPDELHTFMNPQGEVFELVRFARADGARAFGRPSHQFSWYPGHAWRYAGCRGCGAQLGWCFEGAGAEGPSHFWGLVRGALSWP